MAKLAFWLSISVLAVSVASAKEVSVEDSKKFKKCLSDFTAKLDEPYNEKERLAYQKAVKDCKKVALASDSRGQKDSKYQKFYRKCKRFRARQARTIGVKKATALLKTCKKWAKQFDRIKPEAGLKKCEIRSCYKGPQFTACENEYQARGSVGVYPCRTIFSALACMNKVRGLEGKYPNIVNWKAESRQGKVYCLKI